MWALKRLPATRVARLAGVIGPCSTALAQHSQAPAATAAAACAAAMHLRPSNLAFPFSSCGPPKLSPEAEEQSKELDTLLSAAAKDSDVGKIFEVIDKDFESATERNVTTAFVKIAALGADADEAKKEELTSSRSFQTLVDMVLLGTRRYDNASLLAITDACGKLSFDNDMLLDTISARLLGNIHELGAAELHALVTSLSDLSSPSIVLFQALQERVQQLGDEVTPEQEQDIKAAFAKLGYSESADTTT